MELSEADITNIEINSPNSTSREEFAVKKGDYYQLKNLDGHCIFLLPKTNTCKVYSFRPKGCQFYPMIYDTLHNECILDEECPHYKIFYSNPSNFRKKCLDLRRWLKLHVFKEI